MALDPIISRTDLGLYLRRALDDDELALIAVNAASAIVRDHTEQELSFDADDTARFLIGGDTYKLLLPELPIIAIDEVRVDDEVTLDWEIRTAGILLSTNGYFSKGEIVEVDYSHGFEEIPSGIRMVALTVAGRIWHQGLARQEAVGASSITYSVAASTDLSSGEKAILAKYRRPKGANELLEAASS